MSREDPGTVHVVARFSVEPDRVEEFIQRVSQTLVEPTRAETGCIRYDLCQDLGEPNRLAMIETWESEAALSAHLARDSVARAVGALRSLSPGKPEVMRFRGV